VSPLAGLNAGLLVSRQHIIGGVQRGSVPDPLVKIQDGAGLFGKLRVPRENPSAVTPRANGILAEPTPQRRATDAGHDSLLDDLALNF
jgi:hypothetical protein